MPAKVDLLGMLRTAGVKEKDSGAAVDYFGKRFLRVTMDPADREKLVGFMKDREWTETNLRELLHLILSMPEYQLA
jgi:hypothetical protein